MPEKRTVTFEVEYDYIEPGTLVVPTTPSAGLPMYRRVYQVQTCREPRTSEGRAFCRVLTHPEGRHQGVLVAVEKLREVSVNELTEDQTSLREHA